MTLHHRGCPIRKSAGITDISSLPQLIAGNHVLHRLSVPRHSPYALFRLNSRFRFFSILSWNETFEFSLFCLSFANNCSLGCKLKDLCSLIHVSVRLGFFSKIRNWRNCSHFFCTEKPLKIISNKFFSKSTFFKLTIYNYLFRFFLLIRFSMNICLSAW